MNIKILTTIAVTALLTFTANAQKAGGGAGGANAAGTGSIGGSSAAGGASGAVQPPHPNSGPVSPANPGNVTPANPSPTAPAQASPAAIAPIVSGAQPLNNPLIVTASTFANGNSVNPGTNNLALGTNALRLGSNQFALRTNNFGNGVLTPTGTTNNQILLQP